MRSMGGEQVGALSASTSLMHVQMYVQKCLTVELKLHNLRLLTTSEMVRQNTFFELLTGVQW